MQCQNCQHENPPGQKFCGECGTVLPSGCPHCGAANASGQKFCGQCGTRLQGDDSKTPPAQSYTPAHLAQRILTSRAALEGERKQVTVLFCDIANSTALSQKVGADNMHGVLNRFFELAMAQVHRFEGTINQFLGDGFMALFGAPLAHEDHARRALLAAWGVQQALQEKSDGLTLRMGVHTGQVVVGKIGDNLRMDYTAVGDTTNLAARLQQHAQLGTVLVSELTFHRAGGGVRAEPMPPMSLKGIAEPVNALRLLGVASRRSALGAGEDRLLSGFVGRARELSTLLDAMEQARAGQGQVIGIVGEPGSGKSRLLYEFRQRIAQEPATYLEGRCVSFGKGIAYLPLQEIARANCGISDTDAALDIGDKVRRELQEVGIDAQERAPYLLHLIGVKEGTQPIAHTGPETIKARIFDTLRQLSLKAASKQLLIFCVEDLHWMDGVSEEYLSGFVDALSNAPILLITTYRPGYSPPWMDRSFCTQVSLRPLSSQDSTSIVRSVQQRVAMLSDEDFRIVIKKAEGNPFFLEELARVMTERGSDVIPETIQGVLAARIDRLPESARRLLQCTSVLGREAPAALLRRVSDETTSFDELVQILKRAELMHERTEGTERTLVFKHVLTQEVAYASLLVGRDKRCMKLRDAPSKRSMGIIWTHISRRSLITTAEAPMNRRPSTIYNLHLRKRREPMPCKKPRHFSTKPTH